MFEEGKSNYYKVQNIAEIEDFDKDDYGNTWYNVKFQGNAETFMWLAKNIPEENKEYYGHLEKTKSGKRLRFKTDKKPDLVSSTTTPESKDTQDNISRSVALKAAVDFGVANKYDDSTTLELADKFLVWLQNTGSQSSSPAVPTPAGTKETQEEKSQPARDHEFSKEPVFDPETGDRLL